MLLRNRENQEIDLEEFANMLIAPIADLPQNRTVTSVISGQAAFGKTLCQLMPVSC
jgi:hypothetical protein